MMCLHAHISIAVPGTCGELVQGWSAEWDEPVLVSCPIAQFNRLTIRSLAESTVMVTPDNPTATSKLNRAAHLALKVVPRSKRTGIWLARHRTLPSERGMGSSTADITAAVVGVGELHGHTFSPAEIARLACQIEPSDSTMFAPLTALAYRSGNHYREIGNVPPLTVLMLDFGQRINTQTFNEHLDEIRLRQLAPQTTEALHLLAEGIARSDFSAIGAAATLSAESFQRVSHRDYLPRVRQWARETAALGIVRAHSGSVMGLLYPPDAGTADISRWVGQRFSGRVSVTALAGGGAKVERYAGKI